jgi:phenylalanyl-tRNA synthetase beta chain
MRIPIVEALPVPRVSPFRPRSRTSALWCPCACRLRRWRMPCAREPANCWKTLSCSASSPGPQIGEDRMSLTFALRFRAPDRTLTEDDAGAARDAAVRRAAEAVGVVLRA